MKRLGKFFFNGLVLTITSISLSSISVWFSVYISKKIGTEAMGIFQLIMSVYSFGITFAISGISLAAMRLVAEQPASLHKRIVLRCMCYSLSFSVTGCIVLFFGAEFIGTNWLMSPDTIMPLKVMAFTLPFVSMSAVLGGYFTAIRKAAKNAAVSLFEQFMRITLTMYALNLLFPPGLKFACLAISLSSAVSEAGSFLFSYLLYRLNIARQKRLSVSQGHIDITKNMLSIALPVALSAYIRSGLVTLKNILVPIRLKMSGLSSEGSLKLFGTVHGVVLPVILFPSSFLFSFTDLLIPELAKSSSVGHKNHVSYMVNRMIHITLLFSIGVCGIIFIFSDIISQAVYNNAEVYRYIKFLAPIIPFMYLDHAVDSMLKGLNEQLYCMRINILDALMCVLLVYFTLPVYGINAYFFMIYISELVNFYFSIRRLTKITDFRISLAKQVLFPMLAIGVATIITQIMFKYLNFDKVILMILAILSSIIIYIPILYMSGSIEKADILWVKGIFKNSRD